MADAAVPERGRQSPCTSKIELALTVSAGSGDNELWGYSSALPLASGTQGLHGSVCSKNYRCVSESTESHFDTVGVNGKMRFMEGTTRSHRPCGMTFRQKEERDA